VPAPAVTEKLTRRLHLNRGDYRRNHWLARGYRCLGCFSILYKSILQERDLQPSDQRGPHVRATYQS
jgi:hypothetical protein